MYFFEVYFLKLIMHLVTLADAIHKNIYLFTRIFLLTYLATVSETTIKWHLTLFPFSFSLSCLCFFLLLY